MKICVDENIPNVTVQELRLLGHDVLDIRGTVDQGMDDAILWARVQAQHRLLITTDKGFVWRRDESNWGILVVRLRQPNEQKVHQRVMQAVTFTGLIFIGGTFMLGWNLHTMLPTTKMAGTLSRRCRHGTRACGWSSKAGRNSNLMILQSTSFLMLRPNTWRF